MVKVDLHTDVPRFIRHRCNAEEAVAFYEQLEKVRSEPIANSEAIVDTRLSRYILRFFRFRRNIAVFEYAAAGDLIRVLECQKTRQQQGGKRPAGDRP